MDYRDNFQDMIARYNRELMRAYQKRRQEEAGAREPVSAADTPQEVVSVSAAMPQTTVSAPEKAASVAAPVAAPEKAAPVGAPEKTVSVSAPVAAPEEAVPVAALVAEPEMGVSVCDTDTRPRYPLFTKEDTPAPAASAEADAAAINKETVPVAAMAGEDPLPSEAEAATETAPMPEPVAVPAPAPTPEVGYLQIWVTTARDAVPIEGAHVTVSREENGERVAYFIGMTDRSGKTALFPLPAAAAALSQSPGAEGPTYTPYNIDVYANGYYRMENLGLPMYGGIKAELPVQLIPLPENGQASDTLIFPDSGPTALSSEGGRMQ